jgi:hypothetical protein
MSFIALNKLKQEAYNVTASQVEATWLHSVGCPHSTHSWHSMEGLCVLPQMCVCHIITGDKNRPVIKVFFPLLVCLSLYEKLSKIFQKLCYNLNALWNKKYLFLWFPDSSFQLDGIWKNGSTNKYQPRSSTGLGNVQPVGHMRPAKYVNVACEHFLGSPYKYLVC